MRRLDMAHRDTLPLAYDYDQRPIYEDDVDGWTVPLLLRLAAYVVFMTVLVVGVAFAVSLV